MTSGEQYSYIDKDIRYNMIDIEKREIEKKKKRERERERERERGGGGREPEKVEWMNQKVKETSAQLIKKHKNLNYN